MSRTRVISKGYHCDMVVTHDSIDKAMTHIKQMFDSIPDKHAESCWIAVQALVNTIITEETKLGAEDVKNDNN